MSADLRACTRPARERLSQRCAALSVSITAPLPMRPCPWQARAGPLMQALSAAPCRWGMLSTLSSFGCAFTQKEAGQHLAVGCANYWGCRPERLHGKSSLLKCKAYMPPAPLHPPSKLGRPPAPLHPPANLGCPPAPALKAGLPPCARAPTLAYPTPCTPAGPSPDPVRLQSGGCQAGVCRGDQQGGPGGEGRGGCAAVRGQRPGRRLLRYVGDV